MNSTQQNRDFTRVGKSKIHGTGVFAKRKIPKGTRIFEYKGKRVRKDALMLEVEKGRSSLMYVLNVNPTQAVDGEQGGNEARFINHSCAPNCEVYVFDDTPYIYAMRDIIRGEELTFNYQLQSVSGKRLTPKKQREMFPCYCGDSDCRGTMVAKQQRNKRTE